MAVPGIEDAVAQPRTVAHQMADGDRPPGGLGLVQRGRAGAQNHAVSKLRNEGLDRIVQPQSAFLDQQQRGAGGDQLGIGKDAKDVVDPQWRLRFLVGPSDAIHVHQISADQHRGRNTGQDVAVNEALHGGVGLPEIVAVGGHSHIFHGRSLISNTDKMRSKR